MQNNHTTNIEDESQSDIEPSNVNGGVTEATTSTEMAATTATTATATKPVTEESHANGDSGDEVLISTITHYKS